MADTSAAPALSDIVRERSSEILAGWIVRFERSPLRFRRATKAATHTAQVANLVEALGGAPTSEMHPGSSAARELGCAAFLGAQFAPGCDRFRHRRADARAARRDRPMTTPEDGAALGRLFEWLTVVALDAFASSGLQSLRERVAEQLEVGTPVVEVLPKVPACLLVGAPTANMIDNLLSRAWMLAVGTGAPCMIVDCGGLAEAGEKNFEAGYREFLGQAEGSAIQILLSSARRALRDRATGLASERGLAFQHFERLDSAVAHAVERAGYLLMRRS
jgi:hypothetical protein